MATDRRQAICDWLAANGIDPNYVPRGTDAARETRTLRSQLSARVGR